MQDKYGTIDYEFKAVMNCIEADKLTKEANIEITVPEIETKETEGYLFGIGAKVEYYYHIKSNLMKGTVKRISEDFDWLNTTLLRLYPFLLVHYVLCSCPNWSLSGKISKTPTSNGKKISNNIYSI